MMKWHLLLLFTMFSAASQATCREGGVTSLIRATEFVRRESSGAQLRLNLPPNTVVHIVTMNSAKVELLASTEIDGKSLSMLGELEADAVNSTLACSVP